MIKSETIQFITALKMAYLNYYKNLSKEEYEMLIDIWQQDFEDIPYKIVMLAFTKYRNGTEGQFPPTSGSLKEIILKMKPDNELSANEAFDLVYKAICNSSYYSNAVEYYQKLPDIIKNIVSIDRLMQLAREGNSSSRTSFEISFKKEYEKALKEKREFDSLPLKQQDNLLKIKNMTSQLFNSAVLGHKDQKLLGGELDNK